MTHEIYILLYFFTKQRFLTVCSLFGQIQHLVLRTKYRQFYMACVDYRHDGVGLVPHVIVYCIFRELFSHTGSVYTGSVYSLFSFSDAGLSTNSNDGASCKEAGSWY